MTNSVAINESIDTPRTVYLSEYEVPNFLIDDVQLFFDLKEDEALVTSKMRIRHNRLNQSKSRELILNGEDLTLCTIQLDGKLLELSQYQLMDNFLIIHQVPDHFELEIVVRIYPQTNTKLSGLYRSANTFCTQCEAEGFRRITYYLDHPDVLARFTTTITADQKKFPYLLSNGNLVASGQLEDGRHWAKWEDPFKKPSYLFALVAGDFDVVNDTFVTTSNREVALQIFVEKGYGDQSAHAMYSVKEAMRWDEKTFGREYDLDIYMIVAISDFNMGAMENKGLNIFNTKYVLAKPETATDDDYIHILSVVGHEYFHNWSGNRVTCRDWFQLSLKEGLTIFRDQLFTEDMLSKSVMRIRDVIYLREIQFPEDASPLAHAVRPESYIEINNFYTATVYNKGAEVLRMLRTILGTSLFRKGMDLYFAQHDGQAITIEDFIKNMEDVSGINLSQFRLWYSQAGTPCVKAYGEYDANKSIYKLTLTQHTPETPQQPIKKPLLIPIRMGLLNSKGEAMELQLIDEAKELEKVLCLTKDTQSFEFLNVQEKPIPSLLREFSAPIKLAIDYSDEELFFLFKHDTDAFNRFEAGQQYAMRVLLSLVKKYQHGEELILPQTLLDIYQLILTKNSNDQFLAAEMLKIPSEKYIGEQMNVIDVDAIHRVREFVVQQLATRLENIFLSVYQENKVAINHYQFDVQDIGKRQLKNFCLSYLTRLPQYIDLAVLQFESALTVNMTETQSALNCLSNCDVTFRQKALQQFYDQWKHDALVVDKWFAIQAATKLPIALQDVRKLMSHEAFDLKNPNKVYSLIGTFGRNSINFHAKNGEGYVFLREVVHQLDQLNPQIAARMVKPLTTWKRYDKERQALMREQLELFLQSKKISMDLYELVTKSLES